MNIQTSQRAVRLPVPGTPPPTARSQGFTFLELLGAMAIMAILALALVPAMIRKYDQEAHEREVRTLARLAEGINQSVLRTRTVPVPTALPTSIAQQLGMHVADVNLNARGGRRVFLLDPAVTNLIQLGQTQGLIGNTNELAPILGLVILSSTGADLPADLTSGVAGTSEAFQAIWDSPEGAIPTGLTFSGDGNDLCIQRINLASLYVPLVLNYDVTSSGVAANGRFSIDSSETNALPSSPVWVSSYFKGTILGLHDEAISPNSLQAREVLQNPMSYVYQNGVWRGSLLIGPTVATAPTPADLEAAAQEFVGAALNSTAQGNPQTTQLEAFEALVSYVSNYVAWADLGFPSSGTLYTTLTEAQHILDDATEDLIHRVEVPEVDDDPDTEGYGESIHDYCTPSEHSAGLCADKYGGDGTCEHGGYHDSLGNCYHVDGSDMNSCVHTSSGSITVACTDCAGPDVTTTTDGGTTTTGTTGSSSNTTVVSTTTTGGTQSTTTTSTTTTTTTTTTGVTKVKNNNGHGNNVDGVDVSNPGEGGGGPNGEEDPSGPVDDEIIK